MDAGRQSDPAQRKARTTAERISERELVVTRTVDGQYGEAFLSFAWSVLFGYVLLESLRTRKQQLRAGDEQPAEPTD